MNYILLSQVPAQNVIARKNLKIKIGDCEELEVEALVAVLKDLNPLPLIPAQTKVKWKSQVGNNCVFEIIECPDPTLKGKFFALHFDVWSKHMRQSA